MRKNKKQKEKGRSSDEKSSERQLNCLMDDDVPVVEGYESISQWEQKNGRGFWGNMTNGYISDEDNR